MSDIALPIAAPRMDLVRAFRALRALLRDKEDTAKVFEIMRALNGGATVKGYHRLLRTSDGAALATARTEMARILDDDTLMAKFAPGTVGAHYFAWKRAEGLSAEGLAEVSRSVNGAAKPGDDNPYAWFGRRTRDIHDLWHVLSGYGRDGLGEASLVAFSFAQTRGLGWGFIAIGAIAQALNQREFGAIRAIIEGWRRGRRAAWLLGEDYRRVLGEDLEAARRRLRIQPARAYTVAA
ncbi:MAG TPA: Coq4 family protein [Caulobacteraceae bacterium]|jgi:ubiquinone biosynthesis protein COQ4